MRKIKLYIATTIDGYIASNDGDLDWLSEHSNPERHDYGYKDFFSSIDIVILGGNTYRGIISMDVLWPYREKETYIVTRTPFGVKENIHYITDNIIETISELRQKGGKDIWLVGGGKLTTMLLNSDLVDEMIITVIPIILGKGIALFPDYPKMSNWKAIEVHKFENGVSQTKFVKE